MAMNGWHITYKPSGPREYMQYTLYTMHLSLILLSIHPSIHPSIYSFIYSSIHLFTHPCHHIVSLMRAARLTVMKNRIDHVRYCTILYYMYCADQSAPCMWCDERIFMSWCDERIIITIIIIIIIIIIIHIIIILIIITSIILTIIIIILSSPLSSSYYHYSVPRRSYSSCLHPRYAPIVVVSFYFSYNRRLMC